MQVFVLFSFLFLEQRAIALSASDVDFTNAYIDIGSVFASLISVAVLIFTSRAVMNFLSR